MTRIGSLIAVAPMLAFPAVLVSQDAITALHLAEAEYRGMETLRADFTQTIENPMLGGSVVSIGTLFLAPPNRFAMRFTEPAGDRIVCDGTWLWVHLPSSVPNQVMRQPIPSRGAASPNLLAQFVDRPLEHYLVSYVGSDTLFGDPVDVVRLVPRRDDDPFKEAEVAIVRASGLIRRLHVVEATGQARTVLFDRIRVNVTIADSEFRFVVPQGTRVVGQ